MCQPTAAVAILHRDCGCKPVLFLDEPDLVVRPARRSRRPPGRLLLAVLLLQLQLPLPLRLRLRRPRRELKRTAPGACRLLLRPVGKCGGGSLQVAQRARVHGRRDGLVGLLRSPRAVSERWAERKPASLDGYLVHSEPSAARVRSSLWDVHRVTTMIKQKSTQRTQRPAQKGT